MPSYSKIIVLMCLFVVTMTTSIDAQSRTRDRDQDDDYKAPMTLRDRLYAGSYINTPNIYGSNAGVSFSIGLQPFVGYKYNEYISSGLALKFDYLYIASGGVATNLTDFSATVFTRALLLDKFIVQIEGGLYNDQRQLTFTEKERVSFPIALVGAGYSWGGSEIIIAYEFTGNFLRSGIFPFEYKFGFVYDF